MTDNRPVIEIADVALSGDPAGWRWNVARVLGEERAQHKAEMEALITQLGIMRDKLGEARDEAIEECAKALDNHNGASSAWYAENVIRPLYSTSPQRAPTKTMQEHFNDGDMPAPQLAERSGWRPIDRNGLVTALINAFNHSRGHSDFLERARHLVDVFCSPASEPKE